MILLKYINKFAIILFWFLLIGFITLLIYVNNTDNLLILNNSKELKLAFKDKIVPLYKSIFMETMVKLGWY